MEDAVTWASLAVAVGTGALAFVTWKLAQRTADLAIETKRMAKATEDMAHSTEKMANASETTAQIVVEQRKEERSANVVPIVFQLGRVKLRNRGLAMATDIDASVTWADTVVHTTLSVFPPVIRLGPGEEDWIDVLTETNERDTEGQRVAEIAGIAVKVKWRDPSGVHDTGWQPTERW